MPVHLKPYYVLKSVKQSPVANRPFVEALARCWWYMGKDDGYLAILFHF